MGKAALIKSCLCMTPFLLLATGCNRPLSEMAQVSIKTPSLSGPGAGNGAQSLELPTNKKVCFGVNVTGPGITDKASGTATCAPKFGIVSGFVAEGTELIVIVPTGTDRKFELMVYLADVGAACPTYGDEFITGSQATKIFMSGTTSGVTLTNDDPVKVTLDFPGGAKPLARSIAGSCDGSSLKAKLYSNGDLVDAVTESVLAASSATNESAYLTPVADALGIGVISSGGLVNMSSASQNIKVPDEVFSVTRKPDTGDFYGLQHDGQIVRLTLSGATFSASIPSSSTCPFAVTNCQIPLWIQSISAGYGTDLYGLDHSGAVHSMTAAGPVATGTSVEAQVTQVSYY